MSITKEQAEKFNSWLEDDVKLHTLSCEVCQNNEYNFDLIAVIPQQTEGGGPQQFGATAKGFDLTSPLRKYVHVSCKNCGCVKLFDAHKAGLPDL